MAGQKQSQFAAMCDGAHKLAQGSELAVLYPIQGLGVIASGGRLVCLAEDDKTREIQVAEEEYESNKNNGSSDDCLSGHFWTT